MLGRFQNSILEGYQEKSYDVPLENGLKVGKGIQILEKDGKEYQLECTWVNNMKNGEGVLLDSNYVMAMKLNFKDDIIEGDGFLYDNGQVIFKGTWKEGQRCGYCEEFQSGHKVYAGNYEKDVRNGYGIEYDENGGIVFEGEWVEGKQGLKFIEENKRGEKELIELDENNKKKYIGGFKEGTVIRDGKGVEYDENEKPVRYCIYKEGMIERNIKEFKDNVIVMYDDFGKKVYEGGYKKNRMLNYPPEGQGRQFCDNVMIYNGEFKNGKREGHGCCYYMNRTLKYEGDWMNDKANGQGKFHNEEGMLIAEGDFVDDVYEDATQRIHVDTGKVEQIKKMKGCFC